MLPVVTLISSHDLMGSHQAPKRYRLPSTEASVENIEKFVADFEAGTLKPYHRSEIAPTPGDPAMGPVDVLVGSTFYDASHDLTRDVLIDFYAPWCGHCKKFEPQYKALAKKLKHVQSLRISKLDATRNEVEGMEIRAFPTVALFPAGEKSPKQPVYYQGSRTPEDMIRWLHQVCTIKFDEPPPKPVNATPTIQVSGLLDEDDL